MKTNFFLIALCAFFMLAASSCKKNEGCTDRNSINYSPDAERDNGSCAYEGKAVFWYNQSTSNALQEDGAVVLTYFVDGQIVGSSAVSVYLNSAPACGQDGTITVTKHLGDQERRSFSYRVVDQDGWEYWSGLVEFNANTCWKVQLQ